MKIIEDKNGIKVLHVSDKIPCTCPFKPLMIIQDRLQGMIQVPQSCNNTCPHFFMQPKMVVLSCSGAEHSIVIEPDMKILN